MVTRLASPRKAPLQNRAEALVQTSDFVRKRGAWRSKNKRKPEQHESQGTEDGPHPSSREESIAVARGARYNPKIKLVAPLARYFMET